MDYHHKNTTFTLKGIRHKEIRATFEWACPGNTDLGSSELNVSTRKQFYEVLLFYRIKKVISQDKFKINQWIYQIYDYSKIRRTFCRLQMLSYSVLSFGLMEVSGLLRQQILKCFSLLVTRYQTTTGNGQEWISRKLNQPRIN